MIQKKRILTLALAGALSLAALTGCGGTQGAENTTDGVQSGANAAFRPADTGYPAQDAYRFPYMGLDMTLPQALLTQMENKDVLMLPEESSTPETGIDYAYLSWNTLTQEQKELELTDPSGYTDWLEGITRVGALGMYRADKVDTLDEITGCTTHTKLGESADGAYAYYLSVADAADADMAALLAEVQATLTEITPFAGDSAFSEVRADVSNVGSFATEDINGTAYTDAIFRENKLTLVNVFATWCSPCVAEIPELEELRQEMAAQGVGVVGFVMDTVGADGTVDTEALEKAKLLAERTGAAYPFLMPEETMLNGRLEGLDSYPETFFVDENGNIVGETYLGARDLAGWKSVVEDELAKLEGAA